MMKKTFVILCASVIVLGGCNFFGAFNPDEELPVVAPEAASANASMVDKDGNELGNVKFTETTEGLKISMDLKNVPAGEHGVHIHTVGKCERPDFESAGAHFNPENKQHGVKNPEGPHAGDLPNITPDGEGNVQVEYVANNLTLKSGMANSLFDEDGSAIVLHEKADDYVTDPSGNSGVRIACGVITKE